MIVYVVVGSAPQDSGFWENVKNGGRRGRCQADNVGRKSRRTILYPENLAKMVLTMMVMLMMMTMMKLMDDVICRYLFGGKQATWDRTGTSEPCTR